MKREKSLRQPLGLPLLISAIVCSLYFIIFLMQSIVALKHFNKLYIVVIFLVVLTLFLLLTTLLKARLRFKFGVLLALAHLLFIVSIVMLILLGSEPDWAMYWMEAALLDFPIIPIGFIIDILLSQSDKIFHFTSLLQYPANDVSNFIAPLIAFGVFGTALLFFYANNYCDTIK